MNIDCILPGSVIAEFSFLNVINIDYIHGKVFKKEM